MTIAATAVSVTVTAGVAQASDVGGPISRAEVMQRAEYWLNKSIPYNQAGSYADPAGRRYRTDCSGYVSMALHLSDAPSSAMLLTDSRFTTVSRASLLPGDILTQSGHVILFAGYHVDRVHFTYYSFGSTPVAKRTGTFTGSTLDGWATSGYTARRYDRITESPRRAPSRFSVDVNGNGVSDFGLWRGSDQTFNVLFDSGGEYVRPWGSAGDVAVAGDVNGNGRSDYITWTPSTGMWHVLYDSGGEYHRQWGSAGDVPVAADFDGNGLSDFVTFTPATGMWHILYDSGHQYHRQWGGPGQIPVGGDFDGNGASDFVTFTPSDGNWHVLYDSGQQYHRQWGGPGQIPVGGDFNGNGLSDFVTFTPNDGNWHILYDNGQQYHRHYGGSNYQPV